MYQRRRRKRQNDEEGLYFMTGCPSTIGFGRVHTTDTSEPCPLFQYQVAIHPKIPIHNKKRWCVLLGREIFCHCPSPTLTISNAEWLISSYFDYLRLTNTNFVDLLKSYRDLFEYTNRTMDFLMMNQWRDVSRRVTSFYQQVTRGVKIVNNCLASYRTVFLPQHRMRVDITSITRESYTLFVQRGKKTVAFFATINRATSNHVYDDGGTALIIRQWQEDEREIAECSSVQRPYRYLMFFFPQVEYFSMNNRFLFLVVCLYVCYYSRSPNKHFYITIPNLYIHARGRQKENSHEEKKNQAEMLKYYPRVKYFYTLFLMKKEV